MKNKYIFILISFLLFCFTRNVHALSVSKNDMMIDTGKSEIVNLYANVSEEVESVSFTLTYTTYDIVADFLVNDEFTDKTPNEINHTIIFDKAKTGKILLGTIKISVKDIIKDKYGDVFITKGLAKKVDGDTITLNNQTINIKVNQNKVKNTDNNLLDKIESDIVKIELKKDIFMYEVTIPENTIELDLKPIAKDNDTSIEISSQKISELKDNILIINTKNGDISQEYKIKINMLKEKKVENIQMATIDTGKFSPDYTYKNKWFLVVAVLVILLFGLIVTNRKSRKK